MQTKLTLVLAFASALLALQVADKLAEDGIRVDVIDLAGLRILELGDERGATDGHCGRQDRGTEEEEVLAHEKISNTDYTDYTERTGASV